MDSGSLNELHVLNDPVATASVNIHATHQWYAHTRHVWASIAYESIGCDYDQRPLACILPVRPAPIHKCHCNSSASCRSDRRHCFLYVPIQPSEWIMGLLATLDAPTQYTWVLTRLVHMLHFVASRDLASAHNGHRASHCDLHGSSCRIHSLN